MKVQLKHWKEFRAKWSDWRLIDFYEYLQRVNGRKYAKYLINFELFYLQWMRVYDGNAMQSRFESHVFCGKYLMDFDHSDLLIFCIESKADRRQILMKIQQLNRL